MTATRYERATAPIGDSDANRALREDGLTVYASTNGKNYYQRVARRSIAPIEAPTETEPGSAFGAMLNDSIMGAVFDAGYNTLDKLRAASDEDLLAIDGIGPATLDKIRSATS